MTTTYYNIKTNLGTETIDELSSKDFATSKEFSAERRRLTAEYRLAGFAVYLSSRSTKEWRERQ